MSSVIEDRKKDGRLRFPTYIVEEAKQISQSSVEYVDYAVFETVPESLYSCTRPHQRTQVAQFLDKVILRSSSAASTPTLVIDATANIGCDTSLLAQLFEKATIVALETDESAFRCLCHNMHALFGKQVSTHPSLQDYKQVRIIPLHVDCTLYLRGLMCRTHASRAVADDDAILIYFDPPWGGPDYWRESKLQLKLSGHLMETITSDLYTTAAAKKQSPEAITVVLKAPANFDYRSFEACLAKHATVKLVCEKVDILKAKKNHKGQVSFCMILIRCVCIQSS